MLRDPYVLQLFSASPLFTLAYSGAIPPLFVTTRLNGDFRCQLPFGGIDSSCVFHFIGRSVKELSEV